MKIKKDLKDNNYELLRGMKMNRINLTNESYLYYDKGKFDNWCVYEVNKNGVKKAPKDIDYFNELYEYGKIINKNEIYNDFVKIYNMTTNILEQNVVEEIKNLSSKYGTFKNDIFRVLSILYMAMISEENKKNAILGKRIKRLGVYYLLIKGETPAYCAHFMTGKQWQELDKLCLEGGF